MIDDLPAILTITGGLYPSNTGWVFPDPVTGVKIKGANFAGLLSAVVEYRRVNALPAGNPEREVKVFLCRSNPMLCRSGGFRILGSANLVAEEPKPDAALTERALEWARHRLTAYPVAPPSVDEMRRRADACRQCVLNVKASGCFSCRTMAAIMVRKLSEKLPLLVGRRLGVCSNYAWFNKIAVSAGDIQSDGAAPEGCWRCPQ